MQSIVRTSKDVVKMIIMRSGLVPSAYRLTHPSKEAFSCPVCNYHGPFVDDFPETGPRKHAKCPSCNAFERHRLQFVVMKELAGRFDFSKMSLLHFAPETFFRGIFRKSFGSYTTADMVMPGVDHNVDLTNLPFADDTYDCIFASHVLEHIKEDRKALSEIRRVLKPGGLAVLPVPLIAEVTVEYPEANPHECDHVRAPGFDYLQRYRDFFEEVEEHGTEDYPSEYQLYIYEDRSAWPIETMPLRPTTQGEKHVDIVPVCHVEK